MMKKFSAVLALVAAAGLLSPVYAQEAAAAWQDDRVVFFAPRGRPAGRGLGFLWRIRTTSPAGAGRIAALLAPLYAGRPAPARPSITTRGDVVEISRPAARLQAG